MDPHSPAPAAASAEHGTPRKRNQPDMRGDSESPQHKRMDTSVESPQDSPQQPGGPTGPAPRAAGAGAADEGGETDVERFFARLPAPPASMPPEAALWLRHVICLLLEEQRRALAAASGNSEQMKDALSGAHQKVAELTAELKAACQAAAAVEQKVAQVERSQQRVHRDTAKSLFLRGFDASGPIAPQLEDAFKKVLPPGAPAPKIAAAYRQGSRPNGNRGNRDERPIVADFHSAEAAAAVMRCRRLLRQGAPGRPALQVDWNLTPEEREQRRQLQPVFQQLKELGLRPHYRDRTRLAYFHTNNKLHMYSERDTPAVMQRVAAQRAKERQQGGQAAPAAPTAAEPAAGSSAAAQQAAGGSTNPPRQQKQASKTRARPAAGPAAAATGPAAAAGRRKKASANGAAAGNATPAQPNSAHQDAAPPPPAPPAPQAVEDGRHLPPPAATEGGTRATPDGAAA